MNRRMVHFSAGGIFLAALLLFFLKPLTLAAIGLPVFVHELAHIIVLRLLGLRIKGFRAEFRGFCIEYSGYCGAFGHALAAAAGPAAGFGYAMLASALSSRYNIQWLGLSAGCSLLLSLFNLLPALPLDGGRILENLACAFFGDAAGRCITRAAGLVIGVMLFALGMLIMYKGGGAAVEIAAIWLLLSQDAGHGIVKLREIL